MREVRTSLGYKVGHHGSHNATLNGSAAEDFANLEWLGRHEYAETFVAFVPANKKWADNKSPKPWKHPLKAIDDRLNAKASGRVFRMDRATIPTKPAGVDAAAWNRFTANAIVNRIYAQDTVTD